MKFIVVDDNKTFRVGIKYFLENILNHEVIGMAEDGGEFLDMTCKYDADIILMDIEMPKLNGIETVQKALWENSHFKFIAATSYTDRAYLNELIGAGFKSCVFKTSIYDELNDAIIAVRNKQLYFPKELVIKL
jgi:DNA-binding NarL/FixJ family response regulator